METEYRLGPTALLAIMKVLQDALVEGKDASQGLRDLRLVEDPTSKFRSDSPAVLLEVKV